MVGGRVKKNRKGKKTYNTRDSPVVTDPSTSLALTCLSMGERTGSRVFKWIWSYVKEHSSFVLYIVESLLLSESEMNFKMKCEKRIHNYYICTE